MEKITNFWKKINFIVLNAILLVSCEKTDNFSKISKDYQYTGSYSIPVGKSEITLKEMGYQLPDMWVQFPQLLDLLRVINVRDTLPFDISATSGEISRIKQIIIRIKSQNDFPAKVIINLHFADRWYLPHDSLNQGPITINAGTTNNNGDVTKTGDFQQDFKISREQTANWSEIRYIIIIGYIENNIEDMLQYNTYNSHTLKLELGTRIDFDFNTNTMK